MKSQHFVKDVLAKELGHHMRQESAFPPVREDPCLFQVEVVVGFEVKKLQKEGDENRLVGCRGRPLLEQGLHAVPT